MKNRINKYFFHEFIRYFTVVLFALTAIIWTIQAVNFLDLVTEDGHAFAIYIYYSLLNLPKMLTKLIPFSFLLATAFTILKFEKDNELLVLWTSGLNKIHIVNLIFRISIIVMFFQLLMTSIINPETLKVSRNLLKNSELQFVSSLLKEKEFNDTIKGLTIFVNKKNDLNQYEDIFIRDDKNILSQVSGGSSTIFAKRGYVEEDSKKLVLIDGNIQKTSFEDTAVINFEKTELNFSGLTTKSISKPKLQEISTIQIINCLYDKTKSIRNCGAHKNQVKEVTIEANKRFGMPFFIPLIALVACFLLSSRRERKNYSFYKYLYLFIGFLILLASEITVRYSGTSLNYTLVYYLLPLGMFPIVYLYLMKTFKYENLN